MAGRKKEAQAQEEKAELQEEKTIEETFECLEGILSKMEEGNCSLEESFRCYEQGIKLVKSCYEKIDSVEKKLIVLNEEDLGE